MVIFIFPLRKNICFVSLNPVKLNHQVKLLTNLYFLYSFTNLTTIILFLTFLCDLYTGDQLKKTRIVSFFSFFYLITYVLIKSGHCIAFRGEFLPSQPPTH
jgi:hypothetical protein